MAILLAAGALGGVRAAGDSPFAFDPVADLRRALLTPVSDTRPGAPDLALRKQALHQRVSALCRLPELREALVLREWRDQDPDEQLAVIDQGARLEVARRFRQVLLATLSQGDPVSRLAAVTLVGEVGPALRAVRLPGWSFQEFTPLLIDLIHDAQPAVREAAARALGQVSPDPAVAAAALGGLFQAGEPALRRAAATGLLGLVQSASQVSRRPNGAAGDAVRAEVLHTSRAVLPVAGRGLTDRDAEVRRLSLEAVQDAMLAVERLVSDPRPLVAEQPEEIEAHRRAEDDDRADREALAHALQDLAPRLTAALSDPEPSVRLRAHQALENLEAVWHWLQRQADGSPAPRTTGGPPDPALTPVNAVRAASGPALLDSNGRSLWQLMAGVTDANVQVRRAAVSALEGLGTEAAPAVPALVQALADRDLAVRWGAARTLGKIGPGRAAETVPALTRLLADADLDVRLAAAEALRRYGLSARAAVPALSQALATGDAELRLAAVQALEGIGALDPNLVPQLAAALKAPDARVRQAAARLLGKLGPAALDARTALHQALLDPNEEVRKTAGDALLDILPPPQRPAVTYRPPLETTARAPVLLRPVAVGPASVAGQRVIAAAPGFASSGMPMVTALPAVLLPPVGRPLLTQAP